MTVLGTDRAVDGVLSQAANARAELALERSFLTPERPTLPDRIALQGTLRDGRPVTLLDCMLTRRTIGGRESATVIPDVAELDRYEVFSNLTATSQLTGNVQLLVYEIGTRRTAEVSPDAFAVSYRAGILSWSTGTQQSFIRHALDLRTL